MRSTPNPKARPIRAATSLAARVQQFVREAQVNYRRFFATSEPDLFPKIIERLTTAEAATYDIADLKSRIEKIHTADVRTGHRMDSSRRELYVEGARDRRFFSWTLRDTLAPSASVREIAFVNIAGEISGGERGRLFAFARLLSNSPANIQCFADADCDRVLNRPTPARVWLTDGRDLEGYVFTVDCLAKILQIALGADSVVPSDLLTEIYARGRAVGVLRIMSERTALELPFQVRLAHS